MVVQIFWNNLTKGVTICTSVGIEPKDFLVCKHLQTNTKWKKTPISIQISISKSIPKFTSTRRSEQPWRWKENAGYRCDRNAHFDTIRLPCSCVAIAACSVLVARPSILTLAWEPHLSDIDVRFVIRYLDSTKGSILGNDYE